MLTAQISGPQLGNAVDDALTIVNQAQPYMDIILRVLMDPALPTVADQVRQIGDLPSSTPQPVMPGGPTIKPPGVNLQAVVGPLNAFIWSKQHKVATVALGVAALLAPIAAGVLVGRLTKRCKVAAGK